MSVIQPTRRGALATSAAAAAASLLPEHLAAAPDAINGVTSMTRGIRPFRVDVPDETLVDLRGRLAATRWPDRKRLRMNRKACSSRRCKNSCAIEGQVTTGANARPN
jgi:hypothetical protein